MKNRAIWLVPILFFCAAMGQAADYGFFVKSAEVVRSDKGYLLNADIEYRFSQRAADALKHGVPLTTVVKIRLYRYRRFIWNKTVFSQDLTFRLSYHALRKRYRVFDDSSGSPQYFASLEPALAMMGRLRGLPVMNSDEIEPDTRYEARLKVFLDIEALPLPLRSIAYLIPQWYISSGWYTWSLDELNRR